MYTLNTGPNCSICVPRRSISYVGLHGILARLLTSLDAHQEVMANGLGIHIVVFRLAAALPHNPRNNNMNIQPTVCRHLLVGIKTGDEPGKYAMQSYLSSFSGHIRYTYFMLFSSGLSTVLACMMMASDFSQEPARHVACLSLYNNPGRLHLYTAAFPYCVYGADYICSLYARS